MKSITAVTDSVTLLRGGAVVSNFAGAFGSSLRETRLTAILGYLIALKPNIFCEDFGINGTVESVWLETRHDQDRSDILIKTTEGLGVIEAKVNPTDPLSQAMKYPARWRVLLTPYAPGASQRSFPGIRYRRWIQLASLIEGKRREFIRGEERFVSDTLIKYLKEHTMIPDRDAVEIYSRDVNTDESADFFLKGHLYGCQYEAGSRLPRAMYFAPYFGAKVSSSHPGLQEGIGYVAKIISVQTAENSDDFMAVVREMRGEGFKGERDFVDKFRDWFFDEPRKYSCVFLSRPRMAFNPPIKKKTLRKGVGFMGKGYYTFDSFYRAWGGEQIG